MNHARPHHSCLPRFSLVQAWHTGVMNHTATWLYAVYRRLLYHCFFMLNRCKVKSQGYVYVHVGTDLSRPPCFLIGEADVINRSLRVNQKGLLFDGENGVLFDAPRCSNNDDITSLVTEQSLSYR